MKVWFFYEKWKSSRGRWISGYDAVIAQDCNMTCGYNLVEALYMAYDLIGCVKEDSDRERFYDEPFEYLNDGIFETDSRNFYVGSLDIDVDITLKPYSWRRKGDKAPNTKQFARFRTLKRAFKMCYKNLKLDNHPT